MTTPSSPPTDEFSKLREENRRLLAEQREIHQLTGIDYGAIGQLIKNLKEIISDLVSALEADEPEGHVTFSPAYSKMMNRARAILSTGEADGRTE